MPSLQLRVLRALYRWHRNDLGASRRARSHDSNDGIGAVPVARIPGPADPAAMVPEAPDPVRRTQTTACRIRTRGRRTRIHSTRFLNAEEASFRPSGSDASTRHTIVAP